MDDLNLMDDSSQSQSIMYKLLKVICSFAYAITLTIYSGYVIHYGLKLFVYPVIDVKYHFPMAVVIALKFLYSTITFSTQDVITTMEKVDVTKSMEFKFITVMMYSIAWLVFNTISNYYM